MSEVFTHLKIGNGCHHQLQIFLEDWRDMSPYVGSSARGGGGGQSIGAN